MIQSPSRQATLRRLTLNIHFVPTGLVTNGRFLTTRTTDVFTIVLTAVMLREVGNPQANEDESRRATVARRLEGYLLSGSRLTTRGVPLMPAADSAMAFGS